MDNIIKALIVLFCFYLVSCGYNPLGPGSRYSTLEELAKDIGNDAGKVNVWMSANLQADPNKNKSINTLTNNPIEDMALYTFDVRGGMCLQFACFQAWVHQVANKRAGIIINAGHAWAWFEESGGKISLSAGRDNFDHKKYDNLQHMIDCWSDKTKFIYDAHYNIISDCED